MELDLSIDIDITKLCYRKESLMNKDSYKALGNRFLYSLKFSNLINLSLFIHVYS